MKTQKDTFIQFSDGVSIKTSGKLRTIRRSDGYYVVGEGMCIPVDTYDESQNIIAKMAKKIRRTTIPSYYHNGPMITQDGPYKGKKYPANWLIEKCIDHLYELNQK